MARTPKADKVTIEILRPTAPLPTAPAKLRILETANTLFYGDGIRTVGVDRLISAVERHQGDVLQALRLEGAPDRRVHRIPASPRRRLAR